VPEHCAAERQPTHEPVTALQAGVEPVHAVAFVDEHAPHEPLGWQAGVAPPQSASAVQPRHVCVVVLHAGVEPEQVVFATHATHVAAVVLQAGVAPEHSVALVAEHTPHEPFD
jgi:hypothetical protein